MFAKHWAPGEVKSRLAKDVGAEAASQLYLGFLRTLLVRFSATADERVLVFAPPGRRAEFEELLRSMPGAHPAGGYWSLEPQAEGDLGARMRAFFDWAFAGGATRVVLIGSDSPTLPIEFIDEAFAALAQHPVVLGPASDGGYYLVGAVGQLCDTAVRPAVAASRDAAALRRTATSSSAPPIFDRIDWSTPAVFEQTVERLKAAALTYHVLPPWYDVDELADLARLKREARTLHPSH